MERVDVPPDGIAVNHPGYGVTIASGPTVPADNSVGFAHGCLFAHTDGTTGIDATYINAGTQAASNFDPLDASAADGSGAFDTISEFTTDAGVTVDGVLLKDGIVSQADLALSSTNEINVLIGTVSILAIDDAAIASNAAAAATAGKSLFIETQDGGTAGTADEGLAGANFTLTAGIGSAAGGTSDDLGGDAGCISLVTQAGGAGDGAAANGADGLIRLISNKPLIRKQGAVATATDTATLTTAQLTNGILVGTPTSAADYTLPLAEDLDDLLHNQMGADEAFDITVINEATGDTLTITLLTNTGWTLVGNMVVQENESATHRASAVFTIRRTGSDAFTIYRKS